MVEDDTWTVSGLLYVHAIILDTGTWGNILVKGNGKWAVSYV